MPDTLGSLIVDVLANDTDFAAGMSNVTRLLRATVNSARALADSFESALGGALMSAGRAMADLTAKSATLGIEFEKQINKVAVLAGGGLPELEAAARRMGATTTFSASQAAAAMESLAQAGFKTGEIVAGTEAALALAAASGGDLSTATSLVAATMSQFSLTAADSARISDVFTQALNSSQLNMEGLSVAMSYAGTVGASFGYSLEETTAAVAMFSNLGLEGSKAGTAFRMALSQAANVSTVGAAALKKYGLTVQDINPTLHGFGEILQTIGKAGISTNDALKVFGTEAGGNVAALAKQAVDANHKVGTSFEEIADALNTSQGVAVTTAEAMLKTVSGAFENASGAFEELLLSVYDSYKGPLASLLSQIGETIAYIADRFKEANGGIGADIKSTFDYLSLWLKANEEKLAQTFISLASGLASVVTTAARLIPYLDDIAILIATVFTAVKVNQFVAAIALVAPQVYTAATSLQAFGVALVGATGGIAALTTAVGVILAGLAALVLHYDDATASTEAFAKAAEKSTEILKKEQEAIDKRAESVIESTRTILLAKLKEAQANNQETESLEKQLEYFNELTGDKAAAGALKGELIEIGNEFVRISDIIAQAKQGDTTQLGAIQKQAAQASIRVQDLTGTVATLKKELQKEQGATSFLNQNAGKIQALQQEILLYEDDISKAQSKADGLALAIRKITAAQTVAAKATDDAARSMSGAAEMTDKERRAVEKLVDGLERLEDARLRAADTANASEQGLVEELQKLRGNEEADRLVDLQKRITGINAQADAERAAADDVYRYKVEKMHLTGAALVAATAAYEAQITDIGVREGDRRQLAIDIYTEERKQREAQALQTRLEQERKAADEGAQALIDATEAASAETHQIQLRSMDDRTRLETEKNDKIAAMDRDFMRKLENIEGLSDLQRAGLLLQYQQETAADRFAIEQEYQDKINALTEEEEKGRLGRFLDNLKKALEKAAGIGADIVSGAFAALNMLGLDVTGIAGELGTALDDLASPSQRGSFSPATWAENFVNSLADKAVALAQAVPRIVGPVIQTLAARIPDVVRALIAALPVVVDALVTNLPILVRRVGALLPEIITTLAALIPDLLPALVALIPDLVIEVINALPEIAVALIKAIFTQLLPTIPKIVLELLKGLWEGVKAMIRAIGEFFKNLFKIGGKKREGDRGGARFATGIEYVPHTMRATLEPGEAVLTPDEARANRENAGRASGSARSGGGGGGGGESFAIPFFTDGRLVDGVIVTAAENGRAPRITRMTRRAGGVSVGFWRGRHPSGG